MLLGKIFNIQRYSLHDGNGIRTVVFFKGCFLRCPWCCNPESLSFESEIIKNHSICMNRSVCSNDPDQCPTGALQFVGKDYTILELIQELKKDVVFFETSGGGITLSGGEVLEQPEFAYELLVNLHNMNIHTAIETSGQADTEYFKKVIPYIDEVLFDVKILDKEKAKKVINADLDIILENLTYAAKYAKSLTLRFPAIPKYTTYRANLDSIIKVCKDLKLDLIHILPYHSYGEKKYEYLNIPYTLKDIPLLSEKERDGISMYFQKHKIKTIIGG